MHGDAGVHPLRQALWPLGLAYGVVAAVRNWTFATGMRAVHRLAATVVSVGNLTTGGTGKTPTVAWLCALAKARGRTPGVLARGYGRAPGNELNDEGAMLQRHLPWLLQEQHPDRVAAGERLLRRGADYVVLDDGFQHRRLHRDLDVVCADATLPFGNGHCLPAGDLREFRSGLRRAGVVLLTRAGALSAEQLSPRIERIRALTGGRARVHACDHAAVDVIEVPSMRVHALDALRGQPVVLLSAIARPRAFRATVERLGAVIAGEFHHRDHHRFTAPELAAAASAATAAAAWLLTTAKDDARLGASDLRRHVLRIELRFLHEPPPPAEFLL